MASGAPTGGNAAADGQRWPYDYFVSHAEEDAPWAEWIAWQMEEHAGRRVLVQAWDNVPGSHWSASVQDGIRYARRTLAVVSAGYLRSAFNEAEWEAAFRDDPRGAERRLIPVRIENCPLSGLLGAVSPIDLFNLTAEDAARATLLQGLRAAEAGRAKPAAPPSFPGSAPESGLRGPARPRDPDNPPGFPGAVDLPRAVIAGARDERAGRSDSPREAADDQLSQAGPAPRRPGRLPTHLDVLHIRALRCGAADDRPLAGLVDDVMAQTGQAGLAPDLIVVTGDLTEHGRRSEFDQATELLRALADRLGLAAGRVALVPGTRDVNHAACQAYFLRCEANEEDPVPPYFPKWEHYQRMFTAFYGTGKEKADRELVSVLEPLLDSAEQEGAQAPLVTPAGPFRVGQEWSLFFMPDIRVVVAGLNSTMAASHRREDQYAHLGTAQCAWFTGWLRIAETAGWLRIGAVHHDPGAVGGRAGPNGRIRWPWDAAAEDLGAWLNLVLHGAGEDADRPGGGHLPERPDIPALGAVPRSSRPSSSGPGADPPTSGSDDDDRLGYQLLRIDRGGLTRTRRWFDGSAGRWRGEDAGATGRIRTRIEQDWKAVHNTLAPADPPARPAPVRSGEQHLTRSTRLLSDALLSLGRHWLLALDAFDQLPKRNILHLRSHGDFGEGAVSPVRGVDRGTFLGSFLIRVYEIARLRNPKASISIEAGADGALHLQVMSAGPDGVVEVRPVGVCEDGMSREKLADFVDRVHRRYAAAGPHLVSELVYGGPRADESLVAEARRRGVRLVSFTEYQGLLDLRGYLAKQTARLEADPRYPPSLYVPQRLIRLDQPPQTAETAGTDPDQDGGSGRADSLDAFDAVTRWLAADGPRFILLLADFGHGKTFFLYQLARKLPERLPDLVPVLVDLRSLEKAHTVDELVAAHFMAAGEESFERRKFRYLLGAGRVVLLFDGFDELALRVSYARAADHLQTLLDAVEGNAKIVVTSRRQHFLSDDQVRTALGRKVERTASRLALLDAFAPDQVHAFLVNYFTPPDIADLDADERAARLAEARAKARDRLDLIQDVRDLMGLSRNPRMLGFIAALDEQRLREVQARKGTIGSADLYQRLLDEWLEYEEARAHPPGAAPSLGAAHLWEALTALALKLWATSERLVNLSELTDTVGSTLSEMSGHDLDADQATHVVGSGSLLVRDGDGGFAFIHSSVMEFLIARHAAAELGVLRENGRPALGEKEADRTAADEQAAGGPGAGRPPHVEAPTEEDAPTGEARRPAVLESREMSPLMVDFFCTLAGPEAALRWARAVSADPDATSAGRANALAVARHLGAELVERAQLAGAMLAGHVLAGSRLVEADLRGADLTDTRIASVDLTGADLRDARLGGAQLASATLAHADLRGSNLSGAQLASTSLARADLRNTDLTGAQLASVDLTGADLGGADLTGARLVGVTLAHADLRGVSLADTRFVDCDLTGVILTSPGGGDDGEDTAEQGAESRQSRAPAVAWHRAVLLGVTADPDTWARLAPAAVAGRDRVTLTVPPPAGSVSAVALGPADPGLLAYAVENVVVLADRTTGSLIRTLTGHRGQIAALAFSPDGRRLASGGRRDGSIRIWDVTSGAQLRMIDGLASAGGPGRVLSVAFSPDGTLLAAGCERAVVVLDVATGSPLHQIARAGATCLAFSPDGRELATADRAAWTVGRLSVATGALEELHVADSQGIRSVAFSADGTMIVAGGVHGDVSVWDRSSRQKRAGLDIHAGEIAFVGLSRDGQGIAVDDHGGIWEWNIQGGPAVRHRQPDLGPATALAVDPDWTCLAFASHRMFPGDVDVYGLDREALFARRLAHRFSGMFSGASADAILRSVEFSADGTYILSGRWDGEWRLWDSATGQKHWSGRNDGGLLAAAVQTGHHSFPAAVMSASADGRIADHHLFGRASIGRFVDTGLGSVTAVAFFVAGETVAAGDKDGAVRLCDVRTGSERRRLTGHSGSVKALAFSSDGTMLVSGSSDHTVRLWSLDRRQAQPMTLSGHRAPLLAVALSSDGSRVASADRAGTIRTWVAGTGARHRRMRGHRGAVLAVRFSPDGHRLASCGEDGTVRVWAAETGRELACLTGHGGRVRSVAWSPDGTRLVSGGDDGVVRIWDAGADYALLGILVSLPDGGWAAASADGRYKLSHGEPDRQAGADGDRPAGGAAPFWWALGLSRFEAGELDGHDPAIRRVPDDEPLF